MIAELSSGATEMNKIFMNVASTASSDSDDEVDKRQASTRVPEKSPFAHHSPYSSSSGNKVDDLLGKPKDRMDSSARSAMDSSTSSTRSQGRLFAFMKRHRRASAGTAKKLRFDQSGVSKRRGRRR